MTRIPRPMLVGLLTIALTAPTAQAQQTADAYGWYLGAEGGITSFETPAQTSASIPTLGAHVLIMVKKFGLFVSYEQAFEDDQLTSFADPTVLGGQRPVTFDAIHKVTSAVMAIPWRGSVEPFVGGGLGIYTLGGLEVAGPFPNEDAREAAEERAEDFGSRAFLTGMAGLQIRAGRVAIFGQYQIISNSGDETLMDGPLHSIVGGLRVRLGRTREVYR